MKKKNRTAALTLMFFGYIIIILFLTVFREGFSFDGQLFTNGSIVLSPATTYIMMYNNGAYGLVAYNFFGNIIMFIPFGWYLKHIKPQRKIIKVVFLGILFSLGIEFAQYAFGTGISDIDDVILNTLGVFIGAAIAAVNERK